MNKDKNTGATLVEYMLILALIALVGLVSVVTFGELLAGFVQNIIDSLP